MKDVIPCRVCGGSAEGERLEFNDCYDCDTCQSVQIDGVWYLPDGSEFDPTAEEKEGQ